MFVPCRPDSGKGSPKPSEWNSTARSSREGSSILFASTSTGFLARRRMSASSSSPGVTPAWASTTNSTRSASPIAVRACTAICFVTGLGSAMSTPPVSISRKRSPFHSQTSALRSRVVPWTESTTAARVAVSRLMSVDLPTFGKPTIATVPSERRLQLPGLQLVCDGLVERLFFGCLVRLVAHNGGVSPFGRPRRWTSASQSKSVRMRRSMSAVASL